MNLAFYEKIHFAMYLTFIGGAMDTYTFLKYNAFPVAHSGNLILALSNIYTHHYDLAIKKGLAVLCFFLGVLFARLMQNLLQKLPGWEVYTLFFEAIIFSLIGFPIFYNHPSMVIALIAFTVSIQWVLFNTVEGHSYINLYVSGNIKGLGLNLINYINNPPHAKYTVTTIAPIITPVVLGIPAITFNIHATPISCPENKANVPITIIIENTPLNLLVYLLSKKSPAVSKLYLVDNSQILGPIKNARTILPKPDVSIHHTDDIPDL